MTEIEPPKHRRTGRRVALWCLATVIVVCVGVAAAAALSFGRTIYLSPTLRERVMVEFSEAIPDADIAFEEISVLVEGDWHPRIRLERVDIVPKSGGQTVSFSEVETSLSYRRLLKGQVAPRDVILRGVFLDARRDQSGTLALSFGDGAQPASGASELRSLQDIEAALEDFLTLSQFEHLDLVQIDGMTVRFDDLRARRGWTIDGGQFLMRREEDVLRMSSNLTLLGGRAYASSVEFSYESALGSKLARFGVTFEDVASDDIASQSQALTWLEILRAPISGAMRFDIDESGNLGPLNATLQIGRGVLQPTGGVRPVPFESAVSYLTFDPSTQSIDFQELSVQSAWLRARAEGKAHLQDLRNGLPNVLLGQFNFTQLEGNPAELFDTKVSLDTAQIDLRLTLDPFELSVGQMMMQSEGQSLYLDGVLGAADNAWALRMNGHVDQLSPSALMRWWPEAAIPKARRWVSENVFEANLRDINLALRTVPGDRPDIYLDFDFDQANIRYVKTMPRIEDARGQAVWMNDRFVVLAHAGTVAPGAGGVLDIAGTSFVIPDTRAKPAPAEVNVSAKGTITAGMAMLDKEPLRVASKAALPIDLAQGLAEAEGQVRLTLKEGLKPNEVDFDASARLLNLRTDHFVPDKILSAPQLDLFATPDNVRISGAGRLGAVPFDAEWSSVIGARSNGSSKVVGQIEISEQLVDEFNLGLSRDMVSGTGSGMFTLDLKKGAPPELSVTSDLVGLRTAVAPIGWVKSPQTAGALALTARLTSPVQVSSIELSAPGLDAAGTVSLSDSGGLDRAALSNVRVGRWFEGAVDLVGRGSNRVPALEIKSGRLDLRRTPDSRGGNANPAEGGPIRSKLNRVIVSEGIALTDFTGDFTTVGGLNGSFSGRVNGGAAVQGSVVPQSGRSAVRLISKDGGGVFRSAGVLDQTYGGDLTLTLRPTGGEGQYDGQLNMTNVRVRNAPAMAELLNAISVVGLLDQLGGEGILFTDVESRFRLTPTSITVAQGSAVGPSMGLSMDGYYDLNESQFDMQGVISPIYLVNAIGRPIARKGEGLLGFNYRLRGSASDPRVSVNPLSVLTPGIFRDIFRRPPPKLDDTGTN